MLSDIDLYRVHFSKETRGKQTSIVRKVTDKSSLTLFLIYIVSCNQAIKKSLGSILAGRKGIDFEIRSPFESYLCHELPI